MTPTHLTLAAVAALAVAGAARRRGSPKMAPGYRSWKWTRQDWRSIVPRGKSLDWSKKCGAAGTRTKDERPALCLPLAVIERLNASAEGRKILREQAMKKWRAPKGARVPWHPRIKALHKELEASMPQDNPKLKGSRASSLDHALGLADELRRRWYNAGEEPEDQADEPWEVEDFYLSDQGRIPDDVRRWWESTTGTTYIGHGNYRVVFDMGDGTVLKLALDATGEDENVNEIQAWEEHHDDEASRFLAPLLEGDERYVLMERAEPLSMSAIQRDPSLKRRLDEASRQFNNLALEGKHEIMDIASPSNWGLLNGELVLIDYPEDLQ